MKASPKKRGRGVTIGGLGRGGKFPPKGTERHYLPHEYAKKDGKPKPPIIRGTRTKPGNRGIRNDTGITVIHSGPNRAQRRANKSFFDSYHYDDKDNILKGGHRAKRKEKGRKTFALNRAIQNRIFARDRKERIERHALANNPHRTPSS